MTWLDMTTMTLASLAAFECVVGRLAAMHWREHRPSLMLGYLLAAGVCILAASMTFQRADVGALDLAACGIFVHLALTWREWRHGAPPSACRVPALSMVEVAPSRIDMGDHPGR